MRPRNGRSFLAESTCELRLGPGQHRQAAGVGAFPGSLVHSSVPREVGADRTPRGGTWDSGPAPQRLPEAGEDDPAHFVLTYPPESPRAGRKELSAEAPGP